MNFAEHGDLPTVARVKARTRNGSGEDARESATFWPIDRVMSPDFQAATELTLGN